MEWSFRDSSAWKFETRRSLLGKNLYFNGSY